jgi:Protein of unknown function (DUF2806)
MDPNTVDPRALIDIGTEVGKTAPALLDRLGPMLGILYKPIDIVRTAKADAQAQIIRAEASEKVASIEQRAKFRLQYEAIREQENLEQAVKDSLPLLSESAQPDKLDDDWLTRWTNEVKMVSDPSVRTIWTKILAGEANQPGSYSLKTFDCLRSLSKADAEAFQRVANVALCQAAYFWLPFDHIDWLQKHRAVNFSILAYLGEVGLLQATTSNMTFFTHGEPEFVFVGGGGAVLVVRQTPPSNVGPVRLMVWQFTQVGRQLLRLVQRNRDEENLEIFAGLFRAHQKEAFIGTSSDTEIGYPYVIDRQIA